MMGIQEVQNDLIEFATMTPEEEYAMWLYLAQIGLNMAYGVDEPEYSLDRIIEFNPEYEGTSSKPSLL